MKGGTDHVRSAVLPVPAPPSKRLRKAYRYLDE